MESRRVLFKKSPAKVERMVVFSHLKESENSCVVARLESKLLKKNPTGSYFIFVCIFLDDDGELMKFSSTGKKAERFNVEFEIGVVYDIKHVKVISKLQTAQYSWIRDASFEMMATKDTEVSRHLLDDVHFPNLTYSFLPLASLNAVKIHAIFDTFGYVTDMDDMLIPQESTDSYQSNSKLSVTIANESGVRLVIENMGNFRLEWPNFGIRTDSIIKIKGLELIREEEVEEGEFGIWKAHAFDDTIFRADEQLIEAIEIFNFVHDIVAVPNHSDSSNRSVSPLVDTGTEEDGGSVEGPSHE